MENNSEVINQNNSITNKLSIYNIITGIAFFLYASVLLYFYLQTDAFVPDESWFYSYVNVIDLSKAFFVENYLGYGSLYWIIIKLSQNFAVMRVISWACAIFVPICIYLTLRYVKRSSPRQIMMASICFYSMPLSWFTGKIIGPELISNALGALGVFLVLYSINTKKRTINVGIIILGIAAGIKLQAVAFCVFAFVFFVICQIQDLGALKALKLQKKMVGKVIKNLACWVIFFAIGMIIANPIIITNIEKYIENLLVSSGGAGISIKYLTTVLFADRIAWDFVNYGGMQHSIISIFALLIILLPLKKEDNKFKLSALISIVFLIIICLRASFLGWYLLPMLYIVPLCVSDNLIILLLIVINLFVMKADISYQITSKLDQIYIQENKDSIQLYVSEYDKLYPEYEKFYFIDCNMDIPLDLSSDVALSDSFPQIIYIFNRDKNENGINEIIKMAKMEQNGYEIIDQKYNVMVITKD